MHEDEQIERQVQESLVVVWELVPRTNTAPNQVPYGVQNALHSPEVDGAHHLFGP